MFDIGFWELVVIAVVTLLVVGPDEFPTVVRKVSTWVNDARRYVSAIKSDFDREIQKAEELKELIAKEAKIAEMHQEIDENQTAIPVNYDQLRKRPAAKAPDPPYGPQGGDRKKDEEQDKGEGAPPAAGGPADAADKHKE